MAKGAGSGNPRGLVPETQAIWDEKAEFWDERMGEGNAFQRVLIGPASERLLAIRPNELILDVACGNGVFARRLAHLGARVVATASSEEKRALARELGAEDAYGYDEFAERVRADVVLDPVGGPVFAESLKTLKPLGAAVAIGYAGGLWEDLNPAVLVGRNIGVRGFYLGRLMAREAELVRDAIDELVPLWESGAVRPLVGAQYPLERAAEAHRLIEERRSTGKVVLVP